MSQASDELAEYDGDTIKGVLNSKTIRNILFSLGAFLVEKLNDNTAVVTDFIVSIAPSYIDPFVPNIVATALAGLVAFFGAKAVKGRIEVGDIKGIYKKPPTASS